MGIFYVKHALGKNGKPIKVYKIRTMIPGADELYSDLIKIQGLDGYGKIKNDPRVTKIGKFLRKSCLDETPQVFTNLLSGSMALVGIRPRDEES